MNVCGTALVKGGHKMVLELAPASTAEPSFNTPPQPVNLMSQIQDGLLDAHPSKCDLTSRQVQMQINNIQHRFNLIPGAAGQWHSQAMAQLCSWLLKPATNESPSPRMILDEPKEDTAPLALPDLAMVEPDVAAVVEGKPEKDDGNAGIVEGKSEEEDDSDVIVEGMPVEGNSGAVAAASSSSSSSSSSSTKGKAMKHMKNKIRETQNALETWKDAFLTPDCPD